jgi:hypothetical protein
MLSTPQSSLGIILLDEQPPNNTPFTSPYAPSGRFSVQHEDGVFSFPCLVTFGFGSGVIRCHGGCPAACLLMLHVFMTFSEADMES